MIAHRFSMYSCRCDRESLIIGRAGHWESVYTRGMYDWPAIWSALEGVVGLLASPSVSTCWCYLLSAALIASVVYIVRDAGPAGPCVRGWMGYLLPRRIYISRTFLDDLLLFVVGTLIYSFWLFGPLQALLGGTASAVLEGLQVFVGSHVALDGLIARLTVTLAAVIVADLAFFLAHLAQHRVPILWVFHRTHHSAQVLEPFAAFRRHPVDIAFEGAISAVLGGALLGAMMFIGGEQLAPIRIHGVNPLLAGFLLAGFCLQHSHVWLTFGPLDQLLISPAAHQIHHSTAAHHRDRNFGNMFSIWDRCLGTHVRPRARESLTFGLDDGTHQRGLLQLYVQPILTALMLVFARSRRTRDKRP
ncbi:MAG TPA: sterol desaturase family protein [Nannocystis exedens]|nr:sterol desaturase family protein [Nannocystis exedens]